MKKLLLATAVAAATTVSTGAHASAAAITGIQLWIDPGNGYVRVDTDCSALAAPYYAWAPNSLSIYGASTAALRFVGNVCLDIGGGLPYVGLAFNLTGSAVTGAVNGTTFDGGEVGYVTDFGTASGWVYAGEVDATIDNIDCTDVGNPTGGIQWPPLTPTPAISSLPGVPGSPATNSACSATLLGFPAQLFLTGKVFNN